MPMSIRNPRIEQIARNLAADRNVSMTDVILEALEKEVASLKVPLRESNAKLAAKLKALAKPGGRKMTKAEIDAMWGHE